MCGIAGFVGERNPTQLQLMCDSLLHRGPDEWGTRESEFASIGMRRLSIIDLQGSHQPVVNEDGDIWVVFNGEIYNYVELQERLRGLGHSLATNGDAETIVHLYEEYGDECMQYLRGMFACAILDERRRRVLLFRDRVGEKPLYLRNDGRQLLFASELKSILRASSLPEADRSAVADFIAVGYVPGTKTFYAGVEKLGPGEALAWEDGQTRRWRWWSAPHGDKVELSEADALAQLDDELDKVASLTLRSDVEVGAFLSGGLDSSLLVALAARHQTTVKTFAVGYRGAAEGFNELSWAKQVSRHIGTEHHECIIEPSSNLALLPKVLWHFDEPHGEPTSILVYQLSQFVREHVKVALSGTGGDELFFGYPRYRALKHLGAFVALPEWLRSLGRGTIRHIPESVDGNPLVRRMRRFLTARGNSVEQAYADWLCLFDAWGRKRLVGEGVSDAEAGLLSMLAGSGAIHDRAAKVDVDWYLPEYQLAYMDRMSMAASLEVRAPLCDYKLVELAMRLPWQYRLKAGRTKHLLKEAARDLLPPDIIDRKKVGFDSPIGNWFRNDLRGFLGTFLAREQVERTGLLNAEGVEQLVGEHLAGRADHALQLWAVVAVEAWHRMVMEQGSYPGTAPELSDLRGAG